MIGEIDFEALARRAVACHHWHWLSGMQLFGLELRARPLDAVWWNENTAEFAHLLPDLRDPGTLGCIEHALIPLAWDDPDMYLARIDCTPAHSNVAVCWRWTVILPSARGSVCGLYASKAEALVAALESAP